MSHSTETSSSKQYTVIHLEFSSYVGSCVIILEGVDRDIGQVSVNVNVDILAKYQSNWSHLRTLFLHFPQRQDYHFMWSSEP